MNILKTNQKLLQLQQVKRTKGGSILSNIYSISSSYPLLSLIFVIAFGILTNSLFEIINYFFAESSYSLFTLLMVNLSLFLLILGPFVSIWQKHRDLIKPMEITQKKLLITLASGRDNFRDSPSFGVYEALLYNRKDHPAQNALDKVLVVSTEDKATQKMTKDFVKYIQSGGRDAVEKRINIKDQFIESIQDQIEKILAEYLLEYKPYEIVADYTGGTKNMSIALFNHCDKNLITPLYFTNAMENNHSKYTGLLTNKT